MPRFQDSSYIPVLAVRPAEMNALRELPEKDKDALLPAIQLRPWLGSEEFSNTISTVEKAFGENRVWIANLDCDYVEPSEKMDDKGNPVAARQAIETFRNLCDPLNGYESWCDFIQANDNLIPCVQLKDATQFEKQLSKLSSLKRGLVFHLTSINQLPNQQDLAKIREAAKSNEVLFIIDFGELALRQDLNGSIAQWIEALNSISSSIPSCFIAISSTSFPADFSSGLLEQKIKERQLYDVAVATNAGAWKLIYSDRGSARMQAQRGGGGAPYPRIDFPTSDAWYFFRSDYQDGEYQSVAIRTISSKNWNPELRIWGVQMIERTAGGDDNAIISPAKATAVRINIHLHIQLFYDRPDGLLETDDDWVD